MPKVDTAIKKLRLARPSVEVYLNLGATTNKLHQRALPRGCFACNPEWIGDVLGLAFQPSGEFREGFLVCLQRPFTATPEASSVTIKTPLKGLRKRVCNLFLPGSHLVELETPQNSIVGVMVVFG